MYRGIVQCVLDIERVHGTIWFLLKMDFRFLEEDIYIMNQISKESLEKIQDVRTCIKVMDIIHVVKPEWDVQILKYCLELAAPTRKTDVKTDSFSSGK